MRLKCIVGIGFLIKYLSSKKTIEGYVPWVEEQFKISACDWKIFLLCTMLPLIFRLYGEVFHVHIFVGVLVLNVYSFWVHVLFVVIVSFCHVKSCEITMYIFQLFVFIFTEQHNLLLKICCLQVTLFASFVKIWRGRLLQCG